ncbi:GNAT family N-acetyltransferase [Nocardia fusca]|uniref:GNAT family N-acetyltransferase n=1 Tax=Nocardia fusca TaxID=941183 RepID=UPI0037CC7330
MGYEIRRSWQGQGLAGEAAQAVLDEALASGIPRVWATIRPRNTASQHVATRIGMQHHSVGVDSKGRLLYLVSPRHSRLAG